MNNKVSKLALARTGIGTIMGRKSVSKGKEYVRIWVYVPTKGSEDTAFPFKIGDPCLVKIDERKKQLIVKPISKEEAIEQGWRLRSRKTTDT